MILYAIEKAKLNKHTRLDQKILKELPVSPYEIMQVHHLNQKDLRLLMFFCDIRVVQDIPIIAATDNEMRMAYILWRSGGIQEKKDSKNKLLSKTFAFLKDIKKIIRMDGLL